MKKTQTDYGIDGYKFDDEDNAFYDKNALAVDHTLACEKVGLEFPFNVYSPGCKMGGQPLVGRLGHKT